MDAPNQNAEYEHLNRTYGSISQFLKRHQKMSYIEFDYYSVHDFSLFSIEVDYDFDALSDTIKKITSSLSSVKRIFAKPIIHLKDGSSVLPVESVRTIDQNTILYTATHSETVSNIDRNGIKPIKLLTKVYEDNYGIYENVVFCNIVDEVLSFTRKNWRMLKSLIYNSRVLELNLLERLNHLNYFLALGKLHTGYVRDFGKYYAAAKNDLAKLNFIYDTIQPRLKNPVYSKNKLRNKNLPVRKTNIFKLQKDYHRVYCLYQYMQKSGTTTENHAEVSLKELRENYFYYCVMLSLFAVGNFDFEMDETAVIDLKNLDVVFKFKEWTLKLKSVGNYGVSFKMNKGKNTYEFLLIPTLDKCMQNVLLQSNTLEKAYRCLFATPFDDVCQTSSAIRLSKEDVESFRRLQRQLLNAMIYCDNKKDICPFCGGSLNYNPEFERYECENCRLIIDRKVCPTTGENYFETRISNFDVKPLEQKEYGKKNDWLYSLEQEALMHYRNITEIDSNGNLVCPRCGKVHGIVK